MAKTRRLSDETAAVLSAFIRQPGREIFGRELALEQDLPSGTLYPILQRLEDRGFLTSCWEPMEDAVRAKRRPRRLYRMAPREGARAAEAAFDEWQAAQRSANAAAGKAVDA